jgi:hypothetical protein
MDENSERSGASEVVITLLYAIAIGVNVLVVLDTWTDGALSKRLTLELRKMAATAKKYRQEELAIVQASKEVVFEAIQIVESESD